MNKFYILNLFLTNLFNTTYYTIKKEFSQENRELPPSKNKVDFKRLKNNTVKSLNEVEMFLNDFNRFKNYIKLYNILK